MELEDSTTGGTSHDSMELDDSTTGGTPHVSIESDDHTAGGVSVESMEISQAVDIPSSECKSDRTWPFRSGWNTGL